MTTLLTAPTAEEYAPFYADYIQRAKARENLIAAFSELLGVELKDFYSKQNSILKSVK